MPSLYDLSEALNNYDLFTLELEFGNTLDENSLDIYYTSNGKYQPNMTQNTIFTILVRDITSAEKDYRSTELQHGPSIKLKVKGQAKGNKKVRDHQRGNQGTPLIVKNGVYITDPNLQESEDKLFDEQTEWLDTRMKTYVTNFVLDNQGYLVRYWYSNDQLEQDILETILLNNIQTKNYNRGKYKPLTQEQFNIQRYGDLI